MTQLRLYESAQILVPGLLGMLSQRAIPPASVVLLYVVAYASHVLSVYSYNDYCDFRRDSLNPRRSEPRDRTRLGYQTLVLTLVFLTTAGFLPIRVGLLLLGIQLLCMAYSDPRILLKARLLGSEVAHFVAGCGYFLSGVLVAGGRPAQQVLGGSIFGLLYLSGGTFNEIMDCKADRSAGLRHLVVRAGRRWALKGVFAIHYLVLAALVLYEPSAIMAVACGAAVLVYAGVTRRLLLEIDLPHRLLRFRRRYRLMFAALLLMLFAFRALGRAGGSG